MRSPSRKKDPSTTPANDNARLQFNLNARQKERALNPPSDKTLDILHGVPVSDPFRPLEDLDAPGTKSWLQREQKKFADFILGQEKSMAAVTDFLSDAWNYDRHSMTSKYGETYFRTFDKALAPQEVVQKSDSPDGPWTTIIDPNAMSAEGTVALNSWSVSKDGKRIIYCLSENGSDAETVRILDVATGKDLPDVIENGRWTDITWDKDSSDAFHYSYPTHDGTLRSVLKHHVIGTPISEDTLLFDPQVNDAFVSLHRFKTAKYEWINLSIGTEEDGGVLFRPFGSNEAFTELHGPKQYTLWPNVELEDGTVIAFTNKDAPHGKLVKFDPRDPAPEKWQEFLAESPDDVLSSAFLHKGKLFVSYSHDTADLTKVYTPEGEYLYDMPLPIQSIIGYGQVLSEDDTFRIKIASFKSTGDTYTYDVETNSLTFTEKGPLKVDLNDCIVERVYATSKDGTQVPMSIIRHPDTKLDGTAALKLYGYGGFNVPLGPDFSTVNAMFVKAGGIYVQANLRGGGEFGSAWYDGGRLHNKQNVFDDFIACAEYLIGKDYTSSKRLIINGGSNGGLLTAATMLQRPELFGAVVTEVPVTDMFRFQLGSYGAAWKSDYGDPDIKADFNVSAAYSPLHNVKPGAKYPPHLIMTADHDDRVLPWHAFKLAATLQARSHKDNITLLRVEMNAGHGAGKPLNKIIREEAEVTAFIEKAIGPINQAAYKAQLAQKPGKRQPGAKNGK